MRRYFFFGTRNVLLLTTDHYILFYFCMSDCIEYTYILFIYIHCSIDKHSKSFDSYVYRIKTYQFVSFWFDFGRCRKKKCQKNGNMIVVDDFASLILLTAITLSFGCCVSSSSSSVSMSFFHRVDILDHKKCHYFSLFRLQNDFDVKGWLSKNDFFCHITTKWQKIYHCSKSIK